MNVQLEFTFLLTGTMLKHINNMKLTLTKERNDEGQYRYILRNDGRYINVYLTEQEGIEAIDKTAERLKEPQFESIIIKEIEI